MMTFAFCFSSMNTEVALQPQPRGTESWTVRALEVSCCDHCRGCSAVSLSGGSEFLASSLFEVGSSFVNQASPFWSVHVISLHVSRFDVAPLEIDFDRVFILTCFYICIIHNLTSQHFLMKRWFERTLCSILFSMADRNGRRKRVKRICSVDMPWWYPCMIMTLPRFRNAAVLNKGGYWCELYPLYFNVKSHNQSLTILKMFNCGWHYLRL